MVLCGPKVCSSIYVQRCHISPSRDGDQEEQPFGRTVLNALLSQEPWTQCQEAIAQAGHSAVDGRLDGHTTRRLELRWDLLQPNKAAGMSGIEP